MCINLQAVAWCPWQPNVLASGGGTADRHIRFWNANTGSCLSSVDTNSQACFDKILARSINREWLVIGAKKHLSLIKRKWRVKFSKTFLVFSTVNRATDAKLQLMESAENCT